MMAWYSDVHPRNHTWSKSNNIHDMLPSHLADDLIIVWLRCPSLGLRPKRLFKVRTTSYDF